jgi:gluconolactonase
MGSFVLEDVRVLAEGLSYPEGPVEMHDGTVIVVEIGAGRVSRVGVDGTVLVAAVGGGPNGAALGPDGALYVCNNGGLKGREQIAPAIQRVDLDDGSVEVLYAECENRPLRGPNDLVFDTSGNFWFTDFAGNAIYYASPDGTWISCAVDNLNGPNGIGLSPDGSVLYWSQTFTRQVHRRRLSSPGVVVPSPGCDVRALFRFGRVDPDSLLVGLPGSQELDSLAVEANGAVCVGTLVSSGISVVAPDGSTVDNYLLPEPLADGMLTNLCFGGPDLRTAYLTLTMSGRLVSCRWPRPGLRLAFQEPTDT